MSILIVEPVSETAELLRQHLGSGVAVMPSLDSVRRHLERDSGIDVVVLGSGVEPDAGFRFADLMRISRPSLGVVLVRKRVDTALLADALRAGVREVVAERDLAALMPAVHRAQHVAKAIREQTGQEEQEPGQLLGRMVTVFSAKGGCGKTTIATNLAAAIADKGRRNVCLVDLDLAFGDVAIALQLFPSHTIADVVPMSDSLDAPGLLALLTQHSPGLAALVAPLDPGSAEKVPAEAVGNVLHLLRETFDYVIVDTPPAFTDHVLAAFDESDILVLLATLDVPALKNLKLTLETLELLNYSKDHWRVVLNRADSKVGLSLPEVEKTLRVPIIGQIPSSRAVPASVNRGVPIVTEEPNHPVSQAIRQFAEAHVLNDPSTRRSPEHRRSIPKELRSDRRGMLRRKAKSP
jgi:pilus assembly protein CpaE